MTNLDNLNYEYIQAKEPPKREDRLDACNAFGGNLCTLSQKVKCGCLKNSKRSFAQTQGCQLYLTSSILGTMLNSVLIYHGPLGCGSTFISSAGTSTSVQRLRDTNAPGLVWLSTNLDESDVISGGEAKLAAAIRYADREYRPEAIIIANTCVPAIIGDDIDTLIVITVEYTANMGVAFKNQIAGQLISARVIIISDADAVFQLRVSSMKKNQWHISFLQALIQIHIGIWQRRFYALHQNTGERLVKNMLQRLSFQTDLISC